MGYTESVKGGVLAALVGGWRVPASTVPDWFPTAAGRLTPWPCLGSQQARAQEAARTCQLSPLPSRACRSFLVILGYITVLVVVVVEYTYVAIANCKSVVLYHF